MSAVLELDEQSLDVGELTTGTLMRELSQQNRPNWLLCRMMNALEARRAAGGLGWSRLWNKVGVNNFHTHKLLLDRDQALVTRVRDLIGAMPEVEGQGQRAFVQSLFADPALMGFVFYHNIDDKTGQYEGLTLSFGRVIANDRSKRDRVDLILEDRRQEGAVDGLLDRVRLQLCPWSGYQHRQTAEIRPQTGAFQGLYASAVTDYHAWGDQPERAWDHWSTRYIAFFGARSFIPIGSSFA